MNRHSVLFFVLVFVLSAIANQRVDFTRQLKGGLQGAFYSEFYSMYKTGARKIVWFPSAACWMEAAQDSRTCKIWSIMPLRRVEQNKDALVWHYSQKPGVCVKEPSLRYQVQYIGASADTNFNCRAENIFDIDAGDMFSCFGRSIGNPQSILLGRRMSSDEKDRDYILCSSGRISIDQGRFILLYGLTAFQDGVVTLSFSANGLSDIRTYSFAVKNKQIFNTSGNGELIGSEQIVHTSYPGLSMRLSEFNTIRLRISYDYKHLRASDVFDDDIQISLTNLISIVEWISQNPETRGTWQAKDECSLDKRRIF